MSVTWLEFIGNIIYSKIRMSWRPTTFLRILKRNRLEIGLYVFKSVGSKEVCFLVEGRRWLESSQMKETDWQAGSSAQVWDYIQNICWRDYLRETWNMESSLFQSLFSLSSFSSLVNLTFNSATWCWIEEHILLNQLTKSLISEKIVFDAVTSGLHITSC